MEAHALEFIFNKNTGLQVCNFIKKKLQHRCSPVNIKKFLRTPILKSINVTKYTMLSWSEWVYIAQDNYLCNVGPQSKNNIA